MSGLLSFLGVNGPRSLNNGLYVYNRRQLIEEQNRGQGVGGKHRNFINQQIVELHNAITHKAMNKIRQKLLMW